MRAITHNEKHIAFFKPLTDYKEMERWVKDHLQDDTFRLNEWWSCSVVADTTESITISGDEDLVFLYIVDITPVN